MPPNLPLTSANICKIIRESPTRPLQHFAVPYVLKLLGETREGVETLSSFEAVSFAGAAVPVSGWGCGSGLEPRNRKDRGEKRERRGEERKGEERKRRGRGAELE